MTHRSSPEAAREAVGGLESVPAHDSPALRGYAVPGLGRLLTRLRARAQRASLDAALARGDDPCESRVLSHRAAVLTKGRSRERIAAAIEDICSIAGRPPRAFSVAIEPDRDEVAAAEPLLLRVQELVRSSTPVYARGVALVKNLLGEGNSPLYLPTSPGELSHELRLIIAALEGRAHDERRTDG